MMIDLECRRLKENIIKDIPYISFSPKQVFTQDTTFCDSAVNPHIPHWIKMNENGFGDCNAPHNHLRIDLLGKYYFAAVQLAPRAGSGMATVIELQYSEDNANWRSFVSN